MNVNQAVANKDPRTARVIAPSAAHDITIERASMPTAAPQRTVRSVGVKTIWGQVVAMCDADERPLAGVQVDVYAVSSLNDVMHDLPIALLAHIRALLLEKNAPLDLYRSGGDIADMPLISFADVLRLRDIPGYELLAAAAKSQADEAFKQQLCGIPAIFQPLLCYYHPGHFSAVCSASITTDANGRFQFSVQQGANVNAQPGYRFVVRRPITNSLYLTLYNPTPAAWYTRWDWSNIDAVTLRTRHALALRAQSPQ